MAEQVVTAGPLASLERELMVNRERYNTMFALAKRARPRLKAEHFKLNLAQYVAPIIAELPPDNEGPLVSALYELCLELTAVELFERSPAVKALWQNGLPSAASKLAERPAHLTASLTNAIYNLERQTGVDWKFWLSKTCEIQRDCQTAELWLQASQVLAWVSGMAHYRDSAMKLAAVMPGELVERLVPRWDRVQFDPWWSRRPAGNQLQCVHKLGAFVGFGGVFRRPPEVITAGGNKFLVSDGTSEWLLSCDGFGATLKSIFELELTETERDDFSVRLDGMVRWRGKDFLFPELDPVSSYDVSGQVLAVTTQLSHAVFIFVAPESA